MKSQVFRSRKTALSRAFLPIGFALMVSCAPMQNPNNTPRETQTSRVVKVQQVDERELKYRAFVIEELKKKTDYYKFKESFAGVQDAIEKDQFWLRNIKLIFRFSLSRYAKKYGIDAKPEVIITSDELKRQFIANLNNEISEVEVQLDELKNRIKRAEKTKEAFFERYKVRISKECGCMYNHGRKLSKKYRQGLISYDKVKEKSLELSNMHTQCLSEVNVYMRPRLAEIIKKYAYGPFSLCSHVSRYKTWEQYLELNRNLSKLKEQMKKLEDNLRAMRGLRVLLEKPYVKFTSYGMLIDISGDLYSVEDKRVSEQLKKEVDDAIMFYKQNIFRDPKAVSDYIEELMERLDNYAKKEAERIVEERGGYDKFPELREKFERENKPVKRIVTPFDRDYVRPHRY